MIIKILINLNFLLSSQTIIQQLIKKKDIFLFDLFDKAVFDIMSYGSLVLKHHGRFGNHV